jgi:Domain of unknown function (DUF4153)
MDASDQNSNNAAPAAGPPETPAADWHARTWLLAVLGGIIGAIVYFISDMPKSESPEIGYAIIAFSTVAGAAFAFTVERAHIRRNIIFAIIAGLICGLTTYFNIGIGTENSWEIMRISAAILSVGIAAPLFQSWCAAGNPWPIKRSKISYTTIHDYAWTNAVLWIAAWLFTGISFLLILLLGSLFSLIKIDFIRDLLNDSWFIMPFIGFVFGAAIGMLRDRENILITLQVVVRKILSVLAPALGLGLALFLVATIFTGLSPLWDATRYTSTIVLIAAAVSLILANAAIGDNTADEAKSQIIRWGALALCVSTLPLAIIAAISVGIRIDQYGYTPDRLWALLIVVVACAYGAGYVISILRARGQWMQSIRPTNLNLAIGLCAIALIMATPLINFGAISTTSQLARLEKGEVSVQKFDWAALRFDFGKSGKAAIEKLSVSGKTPEIQLAASNVLKIESRWDIEENIADVDFDKLVIVLPDNVALPPELKKILSSDPVSCGIGAECAVFYKAGGKEAIVIDAGCSNCSLTSAHLVLENNEWSRKYGDADAISATEKSLIERAKQGEIEIRSITKRQVFVDGVAVGGILD